MACLFSVWSTRDRIYHGAFERTINRPFGAACAMTKADWAQGLTILIRACMMIVRWAQKTKEKLKSEEEQ